MVVPLAAGRPRAPARRGGSATSPPVFQTPPQLLRARSTSPEDSDRHVALACLSLGYLLHRPRTNLPSEWSRSPPSCRFAHWMRSAASPDKASSAAFCHAALRRSEEHTSELQ